MMNCGSARTTPTRRGGSAAKECAGASAAPACRAWPAMNHQESGHACRKISFRPTTATRVRCTDATPKRGFEAFATSVRLSKEVFEKIATACRQRSGVVSQNTWITEAILEKLDRELPANGTKKKV